MSRKFCKVSPASFREGAVLPASLFDILFGGSPVEPGLFGHGFEGAVALVQKVAIPSSVPILPIIIYATTTICFAPDLKLATLTWDA